MPEAGDAILVETPAALADLAQRLRGAPFIALDTEFLREKTYFPRLCLVQVAAGDVVACVDPLAVPDLGPLLEVLHDPKTTKVLHSARQDFEIFLHLDGRLPAPVFDTQIAAGLLGLPEQVGYATLVERLLGVSLSKAHTRADWARRPLPQAWLDYAADDVRYLAQVYERVRTRLAELGRLDWLAGEFDALLEPALYATRPEDAWLRLSRLERLNDRQRAVLQALAAWREETARREDRPRLWVVRDDVLTDIARSLPASRAALTEIRELPERVLARYGETLLDIVARHRNESLSLPGPSAPALGAEGDAVVDLLAAVVRVRAVEMQVQPTLLATRRDLERLAGGDRAVPALRGWRRQLVGAALEAVLEGRSGLRIDQGRVALTAGDG